MDLNLPPIQPYSFSRTKGERVVAEYVVFNQSKLDEANQKHFPNSEGSIVRVTEQMLKDANVLEDYQEAMRLCKTYVADPVIFELCRQIENRIVEILESRFLLWGHDKWLFLDSPLSSIDKR
jgi:hypothetical protein